MSINSHPNNKYDVTIYNISTAATDPGSGLHIAELHITPKNSLDPVFAGDFKVNQLGSVHNGPFTNVPTPYDPRASSYSHSHWQTSILTTDANEYYWIDYAAFTATGNANIGQVHFLEVYQDDNGFLVNNRPVDGSWYTSANQNNAWFNIWSNGSTDPVDRGTISINVNPVFIRMFVLLYNLPDPFNADFLQVLDLDLISPAITNYGCTDPNAINYDASATIDDGSCTYFGCTNDNAGSWPDINGNDVDGNPCTGSTVFTTQPTGFNITNYPCIDSITGLANGYETVNYNPQASADDGSCLIPVTGCGDNNYLEYNPNADFVDNTTNCLTLAVYGCTDDSYTLSDVNPDVNGNCVSGAVAGSNGLCAPGDGYFAYNYDPAANVNQVSLTDTSNPCGYCTIYGCTDPTAFNYDSSADCDDGSCIPTVTGCFDPQGNDPVTGLPLSSNYNYLGTTGAINHDPSVNVVDISQCYYFPGCTDTADETYYTQTYIDANGVTQLMADTCTGTSVVDYDDGSCSGTTNFIAGCTDPNATNYLASAVVDDCSCTYPNPVGGCMDDTAGDNPDINGDCTSIDPATGNVINVGYPNPHGCGGTDGYLVANYNPAANTNSITDPTTGITTTFSCDYYGCMDSNASNYDQNATLDDGSCIVMGYWASYPARREAISGYQGTELNTGSGANHPVHIRATTQGERLTGNGPSGGYIYGGTKNFGDRDGFTYQEQGQSPKEAMAVAFSLVPDSNFPGLPSWQFFPSIFSTRPGYAEKSVQLQQTNQDLSHNIVIAVAGEFDIAAVDPGFNSTAWYVGTHPTLTFSGINANGIFEFSHGDVDTENMAGDPAHDPVTDGPGFEFEIVEEYTGQARADIVSLLANQRQISVWGNSALDDYLSGHQLVSGTGYITYLKCRFKANNMNFDYATNPSAPLFGITKPRSIGFIYKPGCMDQSLGPNGTSDDCNYWADATVNDPTLCSGTYFGCTDSSATNYDANASCDDGSCIYPQICPTLTGRSNLGPGTHNGNSLVFYSYGLLGYGLEGTLTVGDNPTLTDEQLIDPSLAGHSIGCLGGSGLLNSTSMLPFNNGRAIHASFLMHMCNGYNDSSLVAGYSSPNSANTFLGSPKTDRWSLFTANSSTHNGTGLGNCVTTTADNFYSRTHDRVSNSQYRKWNANRGRLYLKGMHDTYITGGTHGGTSSSKVNILPMLQSTKGLPGGVPYGVHGMYIKFDGLDVNEEYTLLIKYRYIGQWQNKYYHNSHVFGFSSQTDELRSHIRLGWGYYAAGGNNSGSDSNGYNQLIDYNGILGQGVTQIEPDAISNWGGRVGDGPYYSLVEGRLPERLAYTNNNTINPAMNTSFHTDTVNFSPKHANNNVLMLSISNGLRFDIEAIQLYCV